MTNEALDTTLQLVKEMMQYSENAKRCDNCDHCGFSDEDKNMLECTLNPAVIFHVNPYVLCRFHKTIAPKNATKAKKLI